MLGASAQATPYSITVRGIPMSCTAWSGSPVAIILDTSLSDVGLATTTRSGAPLIVINPNVTNRYSDIVTQWWFAHECAHHALPPSANSETNADCFGVRQLVAAGILNTPAELQAFQYELSSLPASPHGHLPGPLRARNIVQCALY